MTHPVMPPACVCHEEPPARFVEFATPLRIQPFPEHMGITMLSIVI